MNIDTFLQQRRAAWQRMETLLATLRRSPQALSAQELEEFGRLYRAATSDLALAQRDFPGAQVTQYLNQLVGNAHAALYRGEPPHWRQLRELYTYRFPRLYRKLAPVYGGRLPAVPAAGAGGLFCRLGAAGSDLRGGRAGHRAAGRPGGAGAAVDGDRAGSALGCLGLYPDQQHPGDVYDAGGRA